MQPWRSLLFVPGDQDDRIAKAAQRRADAIIIDLEDSVSDQSKPHARRQLAAHVPVLKAKGCAVVVRINAGWLIALDDIAAAISAGADALMLPKVESARVPVTVAEIAGEHRKAKGDPGAAIAMIALIESAKGLFRSEEIAAVDSMIGIALGTEDFSLSLGVPPDPECLALPCRQIALAAATRGLMALAMPISIAEFRNLDGFRLAARRARTIGCTGALCIHPRQVDIINEHFSSSSSEIAWAAKAIEAWDAATAAGRSVAALDGQMIDLPVVTRARRLLGAACMIRRPQ